VAGPDDDADPAADDDAPLRTSTVTPLPGVDVTVESGIRRLRRYRRWRRLGITLVTAVVLVGASGWAGVRSDTVRGSGGGYDLAVTYARVARPALAVPWTIRVHRDGGFDGPITIATTTKYFGLFDENGVLPAPSAETAGAALQYWEFDPPPGDTLTIYLDARIGPNIQWGRRATTAIVDDGRFVAAVKYRTWVLP
jgi:hypothetical protein